MLDFRENAKNVTKYSWLQTGDNGCSFYRGRKLEAGYFTETIRFYMDYQKHKTKYSICVSFPRMFQADIDIELCNSVKKLNWFVIC